MSEELPVSPETEVPEYAEPDASFAATCDSIPRTCFAMVWICATLRDVLGHRSPKFFRHPMVRRIWSRAMESSLPRSRNLQAERRARVPSLTMQVQKGVWLKGRDGRARSRICASTDRKTRTVWTLICSGVGPSGAGSLAQLDMSSTALNLRSESGRWNPIMTLLELV